MSMRSPSAEYSHAQYSLATLQYTLKSWWVLATGVTACGWRMMTGQAARMASETLEKGPKPGMGLGTLVSVFPGAG